jgi:hypothetical protein
VILSAIPGRTGTTATAANSVTLGRGSCVPVTCLVRAFAAVAAFFRLAATFFCFLVLTVDNDAAPAPARQRNYRGATGSGSLTSGQELTLPCKHPRRARARKPLGMQDRAGRSCAAARPALPGCLTGADPLLPAHLIGAGWRSRLQREYSILGARARTCRRRRAGGPRREHRQHGAAARQRDP